MSSRRCPWSVLILSVSSLGVLAPVQAFAVISSAESVAPFHDPTSSWYGMTIDPIHRVWAGSSVAIGYYTLLTADHFEVDANDGAGQRGAMLPIGGDVFEVMRTETPPAGPWQGRPPDLRVLHLRNVTEPFRPLPGFYGLYRGDYPATVHNGLRQEQTFILAGTGDGGSGPYRAPDGTAYYVDEEDPMLRWGTNALTERLRKYTGSHVTDAITMDYDVSRFDPPVMGTEYEAGYGRHDSGSGVFVNPFTDADGDGADDADRWLLAGIGIGRKPVDDLGYGTICAADVTQYSDWVEQQLLHDLLPGDMDLDGDVDTRDYLAFKRNVGMDEPTWFDGDFNLNGRLDSEDLRAVRLNLGYSSVPHDFLTTPPETWAGLCRSGEALPEPTALCLLAVLAPAVLRKRRR